MKIEADELLKINHLKNDRMPEADELMNLKDLVIAQGIFLLSHFE
jgi:hypothetical protein